jgi:hypothetical protein
MNPTSRANLHFSQESVKKATLLALVTLVAACSPSVQSATQPTTQSTVQPAAPIGYPEPSVATAISTNNSAADSTQEIAQSFTEAPSTEFTIPREKVVLGGISTEMTVAEVRQRLGKPLFTKVEETGCCGVLVYLEYPTLSLGLYEEGGIFSMGTTHPETPTGAGVRVGDHYKTVTDAYGSPSFSDSKTLRYYVDDSNQSESFSFSLRNSRVVSISYFALLN